MRRLTLKEVKEQHDGILPPDATLRPDEDTKISVQLAKKSE